MEIHDFIRENTAYCIAFLVLAAVCLTGAWLGADYERNTELHDGTDGALERVESGIESAGELIAGSQRRVEEAAETVSAAAERVERSAAAAQEITGGIEACERKLDECVQRSGRIKNILHDIEAEHRQRTAGSPPPGVAK